MDTSNPNNAMPVDAEDAAVSAALDVALAPGAVPGGLVDRVVAATGPAVTARGGITEAGSGGEGKVGDERPGAARGGVLARIGAVQRYAAAAAVLAAVVLGEVWWAGQYQRDGESDGGGGGGGVAMGPQTPGAGDGGAGAGAGAERGGALAPAPPGPSGAAPAMGTEAETATGAASPAAAGTGRAAVDGDLAAGLDQLASAAAEAEVIDQRLGLLAMQVTLVGSEGFWAEAGDESLQDAAAAAELEELSHELGLYF